MTDELVRLSQRRVPVVAMAERSADGSETVEFADGTRLLLDVRDGSVALRRLERLMPAEGIFLEGLRPLIGSFWYRLWFSPLPGSEILAKVGRDESPLPDQGSRDRHSPPRPIPDQR